MGPVLFEETQGYNKWWQQALFLIAPVSGIIVFVTNTFKSKTHTFFNPDLKSLVFLSVMVLIYMWMKSLRLHSKITPTHIQMHYKGIPFAKRNISFSDIQSIALIEYSPLMDYGGWGVRYSLSGNGWCYNVAGNKGIKITYTNNSILLLGTQRAEEALKALKQVPNSSHLLVNKTS